MTKTRGDRLTAARKRFFPSKRAASKALGIPESTYGAHERAETPGGRDFGPEEAKQYARRFRVTPEWLLTGHGDVLAVAELQLTGQDLSGLIDRLALAVNRMSRSEILLRHAMAKLRGPIAEAADTIPQVDHAIDSATKLVDRAERLVVMMETMSENIESLLKEMTETL